MTTNERKAEFNKKVEYCVNSIFDSTNTVSFTDGFARHRKNSPYALCGSVLRGMGLVKNNGSKTKPIYYWDGDKPDSRLCASVAEEIRKRVAARTKAKKCDSKNIPVKEAEDIVEFAQESFNIHDVSDAELWNELKSRGWEVRDSRLIKLLVLS